MVTKEVTTLDNEIERHREIADLMRQFAELSGDAQIFTPTVIASIHVQCGHRLAELKRKIEQATK